MKQNPYLKLLFWLIPFFLISASLGAQTLELTPDQAVELALKQNLSLKNSRLASADSERVWTNGWNVFLPAISATTSLNWSDRLFSDKNTVPSYGSADPLTLSMGVQMSLPLNGSVVSGINQARLEYQAGQLSVQNASAQLKRDVLKSFYSLLTQKANLELLGINLQLAEERLKQVETKYRNGLLPEMEFLSTRVSVGEQKNALRSSKAALENSQRQFLALLGVPVDQTLVLKGSLEKPFVELESKELIDRYLKNNLDLKQLALTGSILEASRKTVMAGYMTPTLSVVPSWSTTINDPGNSDSWESGTWTDSLGLTLSLSVPLDGLIRGSSKSLSVKALDDSVSQARNSYEQGWISQCVQVVNILNTLKNTRESILTSRENRELAGKKYRLVSDAYRKGTRSLLEVETSQAELLGAEQSLLLEQYNYLGTLLDLEYTLNEKLGDRSE